MALNESDLSELLDALRAGGDIDIIRRSLELVLQALIEAEVTEVIGAGPHQRADTRTNPAQRPSSPGARDKSRRRGAGHPQAAPGQLPEGVVGRAAVARERIP